MPQHDRCKASPFENPSDCTIKEIGLFFILKNSPKGNEGVLEKNTNLWSSKGKGSRVRKSLQKEKSYKEIPPKGIREVGHFIIVQLVKYTIIEPLPGPDLTLT